jgi:hypothetical protein
MDMTKSRGFEKVTSTRPDYESYGVGSNLFLPWVAFNAIVDAIDCALGIEVKTSDAVGSPADAADEINIQSKEGTVVLNKSSAGAWLLAAPMGGSPRHRGDDGKVLRIVNGNGMAHTITTPANAVNGTDDTIDFGSGSPVAGNIGDTFILVAWNGIWLLVKVTGSSSSAPAALPSVVSKSADYEITDADGTILFTTGSSTKTGTLPSAVGLAGQSFTIKKVDSGAGIVSLATSSSQKIDGQSSYDLVNQWQFIAVQSDGANYQVIANN